MIIDFEHEVINWEHSQILRNRNKLAGKNNKKQLNENFQLFTEPKMYANLRLEKLKFYTLTTNKLI